MLKTKRILKVIAAIGLVVITLESNINPSKIAGRLGADCDTRKEILNFYAFPKLNYMVLRYNTEKSISKFLDFYSHPLKKEYKDSERSRRYTSQFSRWFNQGSNSLRECYIEDLRREILLGKEV